MKLNKIILFSFGLITVLGAVSALKPNKALAQYYSQGEVQNMITIDKKVRYVNSETFFDNISSSSRVFSDGDIVEFQIKVENTGSETLKNVKITDTLPGNINLIFFPGQYDKNTGKITWNIDVLEKNQNKQYYIRGRVVGIEGGDSRYEKRTNTSEAQAENAYDKDTASYYIARKTIPVTGAEDIGLATVVAVVAGLGALSLRKAARGY
jgi:uncharacterized repeat protein (TIGR01451 family)